MRGIFELYAPLPAEMIPCPTAEMIPCPAVPPACRDDPLPPCPTAPLPAEMAMRDMRMLCGLKAEDGTQLPEISFVSACWCPPTLIHEWSEWSGLILVDIN